MDGEAQEAKKGIEFVFVYSYLNGPLKESRKFDCSLGSFRRKSRSSAEIPPVIKGTKRLEGYAISQSQGK